MKRSIILVALVFSCISCVREKDGGEYGRMVFHASCGDNGTRTSLQQDGSLVWSPADEINVFCNSVSGRFVSTNTVSASVADFQGSLPGLERTESDCFLAVYPYAESNAVVGDALQMTLPAEQTAVQGTFADDLFICVAKSADTDLSFRNVCGGVKFALADEGVKKVIFKGNQGEILAGTIQVQFQDDIPYISNIESGSTEITLTAPGGGTFVPGAWYYIVCCPTALEKGFTIDIYGDDLVGSKTDYYSVEVKRAVWGVLRGLTPDVIGVHPVDLGLPSGILWASCDLGASRPFELGDKYAWGETESKTIGSWAEYTWCEGNGKRLTKYCDNPEYGNPDHRLWLEPEDDVAHLLLGDDWWIPTMTDWAELHAYTTRTAVEDYQGTGVPGTLFTSTVEGYTDQSLFFPYVVYSSASYNGLGKYQHYRVSDRPPTVGGQNYNRNYCYVHDPLGVIARNTQVSLCRVEAIRAVKGRRKVPAELIGCYRSRDTEWMAVDQHCLLEGTEASLHAVVLLPEDAWPQYGIFRWESSDPSVATVTDGLVKAVKAGTADIIATADNGESASYRVTVVAPASFPVPEVVDMGTTVKWATFNLGADAESQEGSDFTWGSVEPWNSDLYYYCQLGEYRFSRGDSRGEYMLKYTPVEEGAAGGVTDGRNYLLPEDDAASVKLGAHWRLPLAREWQELMDNCSWEETVVGSVRCIRLTSRLTGNSIVLPNGGYWTKTLIDPELYSYDSKDCKEALYFSPSPMDGDVYFYPIYRGSLLYYRPVYDDATGEQIPLDADHFPDETFRTFVTDNYDINFDGLLGPGERNIREMKVYGRQISSMKGIEFFTALQTLDCSRNALTELDVTGNTALLKLLCSDNALTELDLSGNTRLTYLSCGGNSISQLDLSYNPDLNTLLCANNKLAMLDLSHSPHLAWLNCSKLPSLDVSSNPELKKLTCYSCSFTTLDLSHNPLLGELDCHSGQLTELDLSHNPVLVKLDCRSNSLTSLDLTYSSILTTVDCSKNQLTSLDVSGAPHLSSVTCSENQLTWLALSDKSDLTQLYCDANELKALDLSASTALTYLDCRGNNLESLQLASPSLAQLYCQDNALVSLDLTAETGILQFNCDNNQLTSLDLSAASSLRELSCIDNRLTALYYSRAKLEKLHCDRNRLTALDLSGASKLTDLTCASNQLTSLTVSDCTSLSTFYCVDNQLSSLDLSHCTKLNDFSGSKNQLTEIDFSHCIVLQICWINVNQLTTVDLSDSPAIWILDCSDNPLQTLYLHSDAGSAYHMIISVPEGTEVIYQ